MLGKCHGHILYVLPSDWPKNGQIKFDQIFHHVYCFQHGAEIKTNRKSVFFDGILCLEKPKIQ